MKITTIHGLMDEDLLDKKVGSEEDDSQCLTWVEYWYNNELVHRSVHLALKEGCFVTGQASSLN